MINPNSKKIYNSIIPKMTELFVDINNQKPSNMMDKDIQNYYKKAGEYLKKIFCQLIDSECKMFTDISISESDEQN